MMWRNISYLFWDPYKSYKYTVRAESTVFIVKYSDASSNHMIWVVELIMSEKRHVIVTYHVEHRWLIHKIISPEIVKNGNNFKDLATDALTINTRHKSE
jgi:hypothetical protein